jgi:hypothetical protein
VTANNASKTYDGQPFSGGNGVTYTGFVNSETATVLGGALSYAGTSQGAVNVGNYAITPQGLTSNNYTINYADGTLTVNPAPVAALPITSIAGALQGMVNKVYDGTTLATLTDANYLLIGWIGNDGARVTKTTGTYDTPTAGSAKTVTVALSAADYLPTGGTNLSNYALPSVITGSVGVITRAPLLVTANNARKTFDGQVYSGGNGVSYSGLVNNETPAVLSGTVTFSGTSQGAVDAGSYVLLPSGMTSGNYILSYQKGSLTIDPVAKDSTQQAAKLEQDASKQVDAAVVMKVVKSVQEIQFPVSRSIATIGLNGSAVKPFENPDLGLLGVTFLTGLDAVPSSAAVSFQQDAESVTLKLAATPLVRPLSETVVFSRKMTEFTVANPIGRMVEFSAGMVNRRLVIVADSDESKKLAKGEMNLVLAAAVMALGRDTPVMLSQLDGIIFDLR